ncbi:FAD/NAD(P)-binding domain-containing protein [Daedaleopsis nitida]|nr:FAD/NAD(P)-binding domain-containing protein [Daedaleopsis nitida]
MLLISDTTCGNAQVSKVACILSTDSCRVTFTDSCQRCMYGSDVVGAPKTVRKHQMTPLLYNSSRLWITTFILSKRQPSSILMAAPKVIIAGAGMAGPVLAMLLKTQGYEPVIYERTDGPTEMGLSICLQPNGLRVLALIPGLLDKIVRRRVEETIAYSSLAEDEGVLARSRVPLYDLCGHGIEGARRPLLLRTLVDAAQERGIPVYFGHQLVDLEQHEESVTVKFANGNTAEGSFVVGCDGLHSNTRICLFGREEATFTGLTQTGGISPRPKILDEQGLYPMMNIYGDGAQLIAYSINDTEMSWAITKRESEAKESWRDMDDAAQQAFKTGPFSQLSFGGGELVQSAGKLIKFGLYDRPELSTWHKGRVVLIGDAAHPTSPHLGQGANQAYEDVYLLVRLLRKHLDPTAGAPSTETLSAAFNELDALRIPRTSELVRKARALGEIRVVSGVERCKKRNDTLREMFSQFDSPGGAEALKAAYADVLTHPFVEGQSEI